MLNILIILLIVVILISLVVIACLSIKVYSLEQNVKILNDAFSNHVIKHITESFLNKKGGQI